MMLSSFDRKLIMALQEDGRASNVDLSQKLGIHVSTIAKRIDELEEHEIMKIQALPNPYKLGYSAHAIIAIETDIRRIDEICARLNNIFNVNLIITAFGRYDIIAVAYFPAMENLLNMVSRELSTINGLKVDTFLIKDVKKRYYGFTIDNTEPIKIDEIDQKIIEKLTENGRCKILNLARELGISPSTCLRRTSRLISEKVIEIRAIPNPSRIGYASNALLFLRVQTDKLENVCNTLRTFDNIFLVATLYNAYDAVIGYHASSPEELYRFKKTIISTDGVLSGDIIVRAEIKKRYYGKLLT
ncbi:MAG TPA: AsnC family transcriptional regulator [Dehalococcoidales bacterium]|nr:AsnC family transcriptional regulator [Dehalococcoidales bacterium]